VAVPLVLLGVGAAVVLTRGGGEATTNTPTVVEVPRDTPRGTRPVAQPVQAGTTATEPQQVSVEFTSSPSGVAILDGAEQIGTTPTKLLLPRDTVHVLKFQLSGYQAQEKTLNFSRAADLAQTVDVKLEPVRTATPRPRNPKQGGSEPNISTFE
jgi:serine/threonine-protein kinase